MIKLTPAAKDTIRANSFKSAREIAELILQKHGIVVSQAYIKTIIKGYESKTADTTELVISEIENNIAEFVNDKTKEYLISLEDNIRNIEEVGWARPTKRRIYKIVQIVVGSGKILALHEGQWKYKQ